MHRLIGRKLWKDDLHGRHLQIRPGNTPVNMYSIQQQLVRPTECFPRDPRVNPNLSDTRIRGRESTSAKLIWTRLSEPSTGDDSIDPNSVQAIRNGSLPALWS